MPTETAPHHRHRTASRWRRVVPALAATALVATACVADGEPSAGPTSTVPLPTDGTVPPPADDLVLAMALRTVDSCDTLLTALKAEALDRVGPYGLGGGGGWFGPFPAAGRLIEEAEVATDEATSEGSGGPATTVSGTNTQEAGVDEPDLVKTDGSRMVVVTGDRVRILDLTGAEPTLAATVRLPDEVYATELFLEGDRALVLSTAWSATPLRSTEDAALVPSGVSTSRLVEVDVAAGRVVRSIEVEGAYLSARAVDGTVRVVVTTPAPDLPFVYPANPAAEEAAEAANRAVVEGSTIEQWLPSYRVLDGEGRPVEDGDLIPCDQLHLPAQFAGFGVIAVVAVDLAGGLDLADVVGVRTDGQTVYASTDRLVVATPRWIDPLIFESGDEARIREVTEETTTALHTFDTTTAGLTSYVASGEVGGRLLNQFALDEHEGTIRVATTEGEVWGGDGSSESFVTVLREAGDRLEVVGRVGGLGKGEQIQSVRFLGDVAYVVTFRQIDPFYVVDLSVPTAPVVRGELKIPGFSSYLHPLSDTLVLGVGQDATEDGRTTGSQLSLFSVADPAAPQRIGQLALGDDSWSLVGSDHRAFLWWEPSRLAVVPVSRWDAGPSGAPFEGVMAVRVDEAGGLALQAQLSHPGGSSCAPLVQPLDGTGSSPVPELRPECYGWQPQITRSVVVGERLYTVSEAGVQAVALADLAQVAWVPFPG